MQYYAGLTMLILLGAMLGILSGRAGVGLLWGVGLAEAAAVGLGNLLAYGKLQRTIAEIFFVGEQFTIISVYEIIHEKPQQAFPLAYANPRISPDRSRVTIHYHDRVMVLRREDWEEFDLICEWLFSRRPWSLSQIRQVWPGVLPQTRRPAQPDGQNPEDPLPPAPEPPPAQ